MCVDNVLNFNISRVLAFASLAFLQAAVAQAQCFERQVFQQAMQQTREALYDGRALSGAQQQGLGDALSRLDVGDLSEQLSAHRLSIYSVFLADTLARLGEVQRSGSVQGTDLTAVDISWAAQILDELCIATQENKVPEHVGQARHFLGLITLTFEDAFVMGDAPDIRSYLNLSLVFALLLGAISLIVFVWKAYVITQRALARRHAAGFETRLIRALSGSAKSVISARFKTQKAPALKTRRGQ